MIKIQKLTIVLSKVIKTPLIGILAALAWMAPSAALAQEIDSTYTLLEDIVIESNRLSIPFQETARAVEVLTSKDLQLLAAQSLPEALSYIPGVDIRQRGPVGVQADMSIRGSTFEQTLLLLNGIKLSDPQTGHHMLNLPLNLDNIEKIVVIKGPAARIFGQNAFAGAVNIITKVPEKRGITLNAYGGDFGTYGATLSLALPGEKLGQYISLSRDASDGYRYNTDFFINNVFYQAELEALGGTFNIQGGYTDREFGANGFYASPDARDQWEAVQTMLASVAYELEKGHVTFKPRVYWRRNQDQYQFVRGRPEIYENIHTTDVVGAELNTSIEHRLGVAGLGFETRREMIESTNLGDRERLNLGWFLENRFSLGERWDVTPGIYLNWFSDFGWNAFPGVDVGYKVSPAVRLFANAGRSFRIPTYTDLYYEDPVNVGNPDLQPEAAMTYELGMKVAGKGYFFQANYFYRNSNELIDWVKNNPDDPWQPRNFTGMNMHGAEFSLQVTPRELFGERFLFEDISLSYTFLDGHLVEEPAFISRYVLENIRHQLIAGFRHSLGIKGLSHQFKWRYIDRVSLDNYMVADAKIMWERKHFSVYTEATNLFDADYTEVNLVPMPGRWFRAGVKVNLGF